jgi:uncharacterized membrane protein
VGGFFPRELVFFIHTVVVTAGRRDLLYCSCNYWKEGLVLGGGIAVVASGKSDYKRVY